MRCFVRSDSISLRGKIRIFPWRTEDSNLEGFIQRNSSQNKRRQVQGSSQEICQFLPEFTIQAPDSTQ